MYYRSEPGNLSLTQLSSNIADEEAGGSRFTGSKVTLLKTGKTEQLRNLVGFLEVKGRVPKEPVLLGFSDPPPADKEEEWTGVVLVGGQQKPVRLYR